MASIFCVTGLASIAARLYARRLNKVKLGADDWLALIALVFVLGLNGKFLGGTIQGAISGHSPVVNDWPVSTDLEHLVEKHKYGFQITEKITFGLIKLSLLFLWKRVVIAWTISFFFATVFQCGTNWTWNWAPIHILDTMHEFTEYPHGVLCYGRVHRFYHHVHARSYDLSGGFICLCRRSWKSQVSSCTIGAGIARMYIYLTMSYDKEDNPDFIADFTLFILWSEIEANVAIIVCCMPTFLPVRGKIRDVVVSRLPSSISKRSLLAEEGNRDATARQDSDGSYMTQKSGVYPGHHVFTEVGLTTTATQGSVNGDIEDGLVRSEGIFTQTKIVRTTEKTESRNSSL